MAKEPNPAPPIHNTPSPSDHIDLLGHECTDKVTRVNGVITSISFDLYGCVQALVQPLPAQNKDGTIKSCLWLDVSRLEIEQDKIMKTPDFLSGYPATGLKGPAQKPDFVGMSTPS